MDVGCPEDNRGSDFLALYMENGMGPISLKMFHGTVQQNEVSVRARTPGQATLLDTTVKLRPGASILLNYGLK